MPLTSFTQISQCNYPIGDHVKHLKLQKISDMSFPVPGIYHGSKTDTKRLNSNYWAERRRDHFFVDSSVYDAHVAYHLANGTEPVSVVEVYGE